MPRVLLCIAMSVVAVAQESAPPKFTARAELVTVPAVVTRSGQFVTGLKQSEFTVLEEGKPQGIAFFEEVKTQPVRPTAHEPGEFSNRLVRPAERPPLTLIVLDRARTPVPEFNNAVNEIKKFVSRYLQPGTPTMLAEVDADGLRVLQDFTTTPEFILDALNGKPKQFVLTTGPIERAAAEILQKDSSDRDNAAQRKRARASSDVLDISSSTNGESVIANPIDVTKSDINPIAETVTSPVDLVRDAIQREQQKNTVATLRAMEQIAASVSGIPGRKTLIWTSPGYVCPMMGTMKDWRGRQVAVVEQCERIWRLLNAANISVYPIVPTQTENPMFSSTPHSSMVQQQLTLLSYAQYTGGKVCTYRNDLDECYHRAAEDSLRYYQLSYYAAPAEKPTWRKIEVLINQPRTSVRARRWYLAGTANDEPIAIEQVAQSIASAVVSPVDYTAIPIAVRWTGVTERDGKKRAGFEIRISPETLTIDDRQKNRLRLAVVAIEMDGDGRVTNGLQQSIDRELSTSARADLNAAGLTYTNSIGISASAVRVKFVVRDAASGRIGTVSARLPR